MTLFQESFVTKYPQILNLEKYFIKKIETSDREKVKMV